VNKKLLLIFVFAFFIRLIALNQSLWLDEATTARVVQQYSYLQIITKFSPFDFHPPLYYLFMKFWTNIFGYSEIALRMPSVLYSLAAGYIVYLIAGVWGAIFFLFNPLIVYYSQEARMYMMATFFVILSFYFFIKTQKLILDNNFFLMNLFLMLSFFTFYGSIFFILATLVYFLFKKQYRYLILTTCYLLLSFLIISPLLYQQWLNSKISLVEVKNWSLVLGKANLKNLLLIPIKFSIGRISFYPKIVYWLITGFFTIFVFFNIFKNFNIKSSLKIKNLKFKIIIFYFFIFPLFLGLIVSFFTPLLQYFRFLYLVPIMAILLSFSLSSKADRQPRGLMIAGFLVFSAVYLLIPKFHREDWKSLVKSLPETQTVYMITSSSDPLKYYNDNLKINELKNLNNEKLSKEIIIIPYTADIHGVNYQKTLQEKKYKLVDKKVLRNIYLERWSSSNTNKSVR